MATIPFFVISPNTLLALIGLVRGPKRVQPPDPDVIRALKVDVVIPAYNESNTIALCLASLMRQTMRPHTVTLIDDGSSDDTADIAEAFAAVNDFPMRVIRRAHSIGKTPGLKRESRERDGDVEFILDGDTILESEDYLEKVVGHLYRVPGIASACGVIYPLRDRDRFAMSQTDGIQRLKQVRPQTVLLPHRPFWRRVAKAISNFDREVLYNFMQNFIYTGEQNLFGSIMNPVGCAVAYRREYLKELFDRFEPKFGDDMTSSEDIFFGFIFIAQGYHNTQVQGVFARSDEPEVQKIPRQLLLWSSAWLQSAYYFPELLLSPFTAIKRWFHERRSARESEKRRIVDGYRQPFGIAFAKLYGRPAGWMTLMAILEKVAFPVILLYLVIIKAWMPLGLTVLAEVLLYIVIIALFSKERRLEFIVKGVVATPIRYSRLVFDIVTIGNFIMDLISGRHRWRK